MRSLSPLLCAGLALSASAFAQDHILRGSLDGSDHQTYRELPFAVPKGVDRITVEFDYSGRDEKTTIDLGLLGPDGFAGRDGFRGWSGGNKRRFTIGANDATPSYRAATLTPGTWKLLLGIPNIRKDARSEYTAKIWFDRADEARAVSPDDVGARRAGPAWYRGDLHLHSGHSDGGCAAQSGARAPCPLFRPCARPPGAASISSPSPRTTPSHTCRRCASWRRTSTSCC